METKKQKIIKVLKRIGIGLSLGFNFLFLLAIIIGSTANKKQVNCCLAESDNVVEKVNNELPKRYVSYNDESYTITLDINEINNYTWFNLIDFIDASVVPSLTYNSVQFDYSDHSDGAFIYSYGNDTNIFLVENNVSFNQAYSVDYSNYVFLYSDYGVFELFNHDLILNVDSAYYDDFKDAVEQDIFVNNPPSINDGIFETLGAGVVAFIGSIGSGISSMVGVFYDSANSQLTTIGLLSVIVVAVSLSYFLFRLIIGLIRMRG